MPVRAAFTADLLERTGAPIPVDADGGFPVRLDGCGISTVVATPAAPERRRTSRAKPSHSMVIMIPIIINC